MRDTEVSSHPERVVHEAVTRGDFTESSDAVAKVVESYRLLLQSISNDGYAPDLTTLDARFTYDRDYLQDVLIVTMVAVPRSSYEV